MPTFPHRERAERGRERARETPSGAPRGTPLPPVSALDELHDRLGNRGMIQLLRARQTGGRPEGGIQRKLAVGPADDPFEREADAAAARIAAGQPAGRISRLPATPLQRTCPQCGSLLTAAPAATVAAPPPCPACAEEERAAALAGAAPPVQRSTANGASEPDGEGAERAIAGAGPGSPLAPAMRATMEQRFGADFSDVRVHTGADADRAVQARAFTHGSHIYLARGESASDPRLIAHELTHTLQQGPEAPVLQRDPQPATHTPTPPATAAPLPATGTLEEAAEKAAKEAAATQPKLAIGPVDDPLEHEADRVADQVMHMPDPEVSIGSIPPQVSRKCAACEEEEDKGRPVLRTKRIGTGGMAAPGFVRAAVRSPGNPLPEEPRSFFEPRFGYDFSQVRVHSNNEAAASARAVNARAYAVGHDLVFAEREYAPQENAGRALLAHELAHVVQQTGGAVPIVSRKPTKGGVQNADYSFSTNCGWIDWGHANPTFARGLIANVQKASDNLKAGGTGAAPSSTPVMMSKKFGVVFSGASMVVTLTRALSPDEVLAVALSMFKNLSVIFEIQQEWTDLVSASSFSQEDLPSNLISFYRAALDYTTDQITQYCGAQDVATSLKEYELTPSFQENRTFSPVGATGPWPNELSTIDERKGAALYKVDSVSVRGPVSGFTFCPVYRVEGLIGGVDILIATLGATKFTAADNVRVVPTYRVDTDRVSGHGHFPFIEVKPYGESDAKAFKAEGLDTPIMVSTSELVCLGGTEGGDVAGHL